MSTVSVDTDKYRECKHIHVNARGIAQREVYIIPVRPEPPRDVPLIPNFIDQLAKSLSTDVWTPDETVFLEKLVRIVEPNRNIPHSNWVPYFTHINYSLAKSKTVLHDGNRVEMRLRIAGKLPATTEKSDVIKIYPFGTDMTWGIVGNDVQLVFRGEKGEDPIHLVAKVEKGTLSLPWDTYSKLPEIGFLEGVFSVKK